MKRKYSERLTDIARKYDLDKKVGYDSTVVHNIIMELFKTRCGNKRTALWGAGRNNTETSHASVILTKYPTYIQGLVCIIDSFPDLQGKEFMGYPIIAPTDTERNEIEIVIITSKVQASSIKADLKKYAPRCEYIDIYEELHKKGMPMYYKFYEETSVYTAIHQMRQVYLTKESQIEKEQSLKDIIAAYLSIKDISYALQYAEEYVEKAYTYHDEMRKFIIEVNDLVSEIKTKNASKKDDVIVYFIDSLRAMDAYEKRDGRYTSKLLKSYLEKSVVFTNVKSTSATTYESMVSVICKKYPFEKNVYENSIMFQFDDCDWLKQVEKQQYDIRFYVSEGYRIIHTTERIKYTTQVYMTEKLWSLACDMAEAEDKTFNFVYFPSELHMPLICGFHQEKPEVTSFVDVGVADTSKFIERQLEECKAYVDREMEYYNTFFCKDALNVVFSDHSQVVYDREEQKPYYMYYNDQARSVGSTFFIRGWGVVPEWNEELVSLYDFNDILKSVIVNKRLDIPKNEVVRYQYYKIHNMKLREIAVKSGYEDYIGGINCFTSKEYLYIITASGVEEVYRLDDRKKNIIETEEGQLFRKKIQNEYDISFPDFILS